MPVPQPPPRKLDTVGQPWCADCFSRHSPGAPCGPLGCPWCKSPQETANCNHCVICGNRHSTRVCPLPAPSACKSCGRCHLNSNCPVYCPVCGRIGAHPYWSANGKSPNGLEVGRVCPEKGVSARCASCLFTSPISPVTGRRIPRPPPATGGLRLTNLDDFARLPISRAIRTAVAETFNTVLHAAQKPVVQEGSEENHVQVLGAEIAPMAVIHAPNGEELHTVKRKPPLIPALDPDAIAAQELVDLRIPTQARQQPVTVLAGERGAQGLFEMLTKLGERDVELSELRDKVQLRTEKAEIAGRVMPGTADFGTHPLSDKMVAPQPVCSDRVKLQWYVKGRPVTDEVACEYYSRQEFFQNKAVKTGYLPEPDLVYDKVNCVDSSPRTLYHSIKLRLSGSVALPDPAVVKEFSEWGVQLIKDMPMHEPWKLSPLTPEQYILEQVEPCKRIPYWRGYQKFLVTWRIPEKFEINVKPLEVAFKDRKSNKGRLLFNPSWESKAVQGWWNANAMRWVKAKELGRNLGGSYDEGIPSFIHGLNAGELEDVITRAYRKVGDDAVFMSSDGSNFDLHQFTELRLAIDNKCHALVRDWLIDTGQFPADLIDTVYEANLRVVHPFVGYAPVYSRKEHRCVREIIVTGELEGSTFTGHPFTSWRNTISSYLYARWTCKLAGIERFHIFVCGDDTLVLIPAAMRDAYAAAFWKTNLPSEPLVPTVFGLGQVAKMLDCDFNRIQFLSKIGYINCAGEARLSRLLPRMVWGGQLSYRISSGYTPADHFTDITHGLDAAAHGHPVVSQLVAQRWRERQKIYPRAGTISSKDIAIANLARHDPRSLYHVNSKALSNPLHWEEWYAHTQVGVTSTTYDYILWETAEDMEISDYPRAR